jgi:FAD-dependent oxidoreductase
MFQMSSFHCYPFITLNFIHENVLNIGIHIMSEKGLDICDKCGATQVDFVYYRADNPNTPRLNEDVMEEMEQICLHKYAGRPHWGKSRVVTFDGISQKYPNIAEFLAVKNKFDPQGLFSSEWSDAILGVAKPGAPGVTIVRPYCALEGLCICSEDVHCAPELNYFCRPGKIYQDARVCQYVA